jgi:hypothetical protein
MWMENSHHDQEPGLRSTWLMGWNVGTTGCHACEERTDIYVHYAAPWLEGRHIKKSVVWGVLGGWVEHGYPMGPMMGRENALMKSAVWGVLGWMGGAAPWWEGRHIMKSPVWGVLGGWVEHGYPMGPMMGRENELMKSAVYGIFVGWVEVCSASCL